MNAYKVSIRSVTATSSISVVIAFAFAVVSVAAGCGAGGGGGGSAGNGGTSEGLVSNARGVPNSNSGNTSCGNTTTSSGGTTTSSGGTSTGSGGTSTSGGTPAQVIASGGNNQPGTAGTALTLPLTAAVEDSNGHPVAGVSVKFTVTNGAGTLSTTFVTTNGSGDASASYTLGALAGTNTVVASVTGASSATFTETGTAAAAQHATYYVSKAAGASDSNNGTSSTYISGTNGPWATIGHAASVAQAGDVVNVDAGNYGESVTIANSGTAGAPIQFHAVAGTNPVVSKFTISGKQYIDIRGFTVVGPKTLPGNWQDMPAVVIDSPSTVINQSVAWTSGRQTAVDTKYATYVNTVNAFFSPYTEGFSISASSNIVIAQNTISLHTIGILPSGGSSQITIDSNNCFHCYVGIENGSSGTPPFSNSVISRNHCYQNLIHGIEVSSGATGITVENNLCEYHAQCQVILTSNAANCLIKNNTGQYGGYYAETMQYPGPSAFDFYGVGAGNVVDGNLAQYQVDVTLTDGSGFIADTSSNPLTFTNNIALNNMGRGISLTSTSNNRVVNNTLVGNGYQNTGAGKGSGLSINNSTGNTIQNNIFASNKYAHINSFVALTSAVLDYNIYAPGIPLAKDSSTFYNTLASLQAISQEGQGINSSPSFVSSTDFHPATGSPAIGAANGGVSPIDDFTGATRSTPTDIGALVH